ncbi:MAG: hypothetical protein FJW39_26610 [Acidobacteria bacterium]|nr:hypothetical protein [Acidobacteriota bacterium]
MAKVQTAPLGADAQRQIEAVRVKNGVRPIPVEHEGVPLGSVPAQVFGFTYSPINESTPLFAERTLASFEVHKVSDTGARLLGFVTAPDAQGFASGGEMSLNLYPEPWGEAKSLIEVPVERIARAKPLSRADGNCMPLQLDSV